MDPIGSKAVCPVDASTFLVGCQAGKIPACKQYGIWALDATILVKPPVVDAGLAEVCSVSQESNEYLDGKVLQLCTASIKYVCANAACIAGNVEPTRV